MKKLCRRDFSRPVPEFRQTKKSLSRLYGMKETKNLNILRGTTLFDIIYLCPLIHIMEVMCISITGEPVQAYLTSFQPTAQGGAMTCCGLLPFTGRQLSAKTHCRFYFPSSHFTSILYSLFFALSSAFYYFLILTF